MWMLVQRQKEYACLIGRKLSQGCGPLSPLLIVIRGCLETERKIFTKIFKSNAAEIAPDLTIRTGAEIYFTNSM